MCGKYYFNQLTVGKQSNMSHSLEPVISCHGIRSDVNYCSDGPGFSQACGQQDTPLSLSVLLCFPLPDSHAILFQESEVMLYATHAVVTAKYIPASQSSHLQAEARGTQALDSSQLCQN